MPVELNTRDGLITLLERARRELMDSFQGVSEERVLLPVEDGWSVKDVLAHVTMWEETALPDMSRAVRGEMTALASWDRTFIDDWNRIQFALRRPFPLAQVLAELTEMRRATIELVKSASEERLTSGFIPTTCAIHARHDRDHAEQIRGWRRNEGV